EAVAHSDRKRVEVLIRVNDNVLFDWFDEYAQLWIERTQDSRADGSEALARVQSIAAAANSVYRGTALLAMADLLTTFDGAQREQWLEVRRRLLSSEGMSPWKLIEVRRAAERCYTQLGWVPGVLQLQLSLGIGYLEDKNDPATALS